MDERYIEIKRRKLKDIAVNLDCKKIEKDIGQYMRDTLRFGEGDLKRNIFKFG